MSPLSLLSSQCNSLTTSTLVISVIAFEVTLSKSVRESFSFFSLVSEEKYLLYITIITSYYIWLVIFVNLLFTHNTGYVNGCGSDSCYRSRHNLVGQSSVNLGAKAKTSVCCSVGLMTVTVLALCLVKLSFLTRTFAKMYVFPSSTCLQKSSQNIILE